MIRIDRGPEPAELVAVRAAELARVRALAAQGPLQAKHFGGRYAVVKESLRRRQENKCCYCESKEQASRNDVEHFRPKTRAERSPGSTDTRGYWWLAWSWDNLLFACRNCNQSPAKLDQFPLAVGSTALQPEEQPPGLEQPLLVDPGSEDGIEHIQFVLTYQGSKQVWMPRARNGSPRGDRTIRVCRLDRPELLDAYTDHVRDHVVPRVDEVDEAMDTGSHELVQRAWKRANVLLKPSLPFVGLSYDALEHFFSDARLKEWGLLRVRPA